MRADRSRSTLSRARALAPLRRRHRVRRNETRSALTALGMIIGVPCVIAMIAIGQGSQASIQARISSLGTNFLMVIPGVATQSGPASSRASRLHPIEALRFE